MAGVEHVHKTGVGYDVRLGQESRPSLLKVGDVTNTSLFIVGGNHDLLFFSSHPLIQLGYCSVLGLYLVEFCWWRLVLIILDKPLILTFLASPCTTMS